MRANEARLQVCGVCVGEGGGGKRSRREMRGEGKEGGARRGEAWLMLENEAQLQLGHMGGEADGIAPFNTLHFSLGNIMVR